MAISLLLESQVINNAIYLMYNIIPQRSKPVQYEFRSFKNIDTNILHKKASQIEWQKIYQSNDVNTKTKLFLSIFHNFMENNIPKKNRSN